MVSFSFLFFQVFLYCGRVLCMIRYESHQFTLVETKLALEYSHEMMKEDRTQASQYRVRTVRTDFQKSYTKLQKGTKRKVQKGTKRYKKVQKGTK